MENSKSFYLPNNQIGFLGRPSVNSASHLSMAILFADLTEQRNLHFKMPEDFQVLIWQECIYYFGTKLINPKRKADTIHDIKMALEVNHPDDSGKEAMQLVLRQKMQELLHHSGGKGASIRHRNFKIKSYQEAAKILGMAGIKDVWSKTKGQTKTKLNFISAVMDALKNLSQMKVKADETERLGLQAGKIKAGEQ
jgi:hypothetical protein